MSCFLTFLTQKKCNHKQLVLKTFLLGKSFKFTRSGLHLFSPTLSMPRPPPLCSINHSTIPRNPLPNTIKEARIKNAIGLGLTMPVCPRRN